MPEHLTRRQRACEAHSRRELVGWHRRAAVDFRARADADEHGHGAVFADFARKHAATALMLQRDGKRRKAVARV